MSMLDGTSSCAKISASVLVADAFVDAQPLDAEGDTANAWLAGATIESGEPAMPVGIDRSSWFRITPQRDLRRNIGVNAQASSGAAWVAVFDGADMASMTPVANHLTTLTSAQSRSVVAVNLQRGHTYWVQIGGDRPFPNALTYVDTAPPVNDAFASSIPFPTNTFSVTGTTEGATSEPGEPDHDPTVSTENSVWYTWTAPRTEQVAVDLVGSDVDQSLGVYTGSSLAALALVGRDSVTSGGERRVAFVATIGTTYRIAVVGDYWGGSFLLNVARPPVNDKFVASTTISGSFGNLIGTNYGATSETGEPAHAGDPRAVRSVWYSWTAPSSGAFQFTTANSSLDTVLSVYTGNSASTLVGVGSNDDIAGASTSRVQFVALTGQTFRIAVAGAGGVGGTFYLRWRPADNDLIASAEVLSARSEVRSGNIDGAGIEPGEPNACTLACDASVWYRWTATANEVVELDTAGSSFDSVLSVYTGAPGSFVLMDRNDDPPSSVLRTSRLRLTVAAGTEYWIQLSRKTFASGSGAFSLAVAVAPSNDDVAGAAPLTTWNASWTGTTENATAEANELPNAGFAASHSVWIAWTPSVSGAATIDTRGSDSDTVLGVYTGSSHPLTPVASNDDDGALRTSMVTISAVAGTTYLVAIDSKVGTDGSVSLNINAPSNDDFYSPTTITDSGFVINGSTIGATTQLGEPIFTDHQQASVWYRWTLTTSQSRLLWVDDVAHARLDVFSGASVNALSRLQFSAASGYLTRSAFVWLPAGTYMVRVASDNPGANFSLNAEAIPANDAITSATTLVPGTTYPLVWSYTPDPWEYQRIQSTSRDAWFTYTPAVTGQHSLVSNNYMRLFDGDPRVDGVEVDIGGQIGFTAEVGHVYYAMVETYGASPNVKFDVAPSNDAFATPRALVDPVANNARLTNLAATCQVGEPNHGGVPCSSSTWYTWRPTTSGLARINTVNSRVPTVVAVYTGTTLATLSTTLVAQSAGPDTETNAAQVEFAAVANTTYRIAVGSRGAAQGSTSVYAGMVPPGDDENNPIVVSGTSASYSGTTKGSTPAPAPVRTAPEHDVWAQWAAPYTGDAYFTLTTGSSWRANLYEIDGAQTTLMTTPAATYQFIPVAAGRYDLPYHVVAGRTYRVRIHQDLYWSTSWDTFTFGVNDPAANEQFASPRTLAPTTMRVMDRTSPGGSLEPGEDDHGEPSTTSSLWYQWTAPTSGPVSFSTVDSDADTTLRAYTGTVLNGGLTTVATGVADGDDAVVSFNAAAGVTYLIAVGVAGAQPAMVLLRRDAPSNDRPEQPDVLSGQSVVTAGSVANGLAHTDELPALQLSDPTWDRFDWLGNQSSVVWYAWTAPSNRPINVQVSAAQTAPLVTVFDGGITPMDEVLRLTKTYNKAYVNDVLVPQTGHTYHIAVGYSGWMSGYDTFDGISADEGAFTLELSAAPANDDFGSASTLNGTYDVASADTYLATREIGEPDHGDVPTNASVWWEWTSPSSAPVTLSTIGSDFDTVIGVYEGSSVGSLTPVRGNDDYPTALRSIITFNAVVGHTYRIAVAGYYGTTGHAIVTLNARPENDDLVDARQLDGNIARDVGYTINATPEAGEPAHGGVTADETIWYVWTAPVSGAVTMDTFGSDFDTTLAVYGGTTYGTLGSALAENDDSGLMTQSSITFTATAGVTYAIAVGTKGTPGNVSIRVNPRAPLVPDLVSPVGGASSVSRVGPVTVRAHHEDVAVLVGSTVEVCGDASAPAAPWSVNCVSGYQVVTSPVTYGDGSLVTLHVPLPMATGSTMLWHARTDDSAGVSSAWSPVESFVVGVSLSVSASTLGHDDASRDTGSLGLGAATPAAPSDTGPAGSGQTLAGAAIILSTTSDGAYDIQLEHTDFTGAGGRTMPSSRLLFKDHASGIDIIDQPVWTALTPAPTVVEHDTGGLPHAFEHDLRFAPEAGDVAGAYTSQLTYNVTPTA